MVFMGFMVNVREMTKEDVKKLKELHARYFNHKLSYKHVTGKLVAEIDGKPVAYGILIPTFEAIAVTDLSKPLEHRMESLDQLFYAAKQIASGLSDNLIVHAENKLFSNTLRRRFGFEKLRGDALVLEL